MAKQRQSVQKRMREAKKREREQRKRAKAAEKAERRKGDSMTKEEYERAQARIEELMDADAQKGTPDGEELDLLVGRVEEYERKHCPMDGTGQGDPSAIQ